MWNILTSNVSHVHQRIPFASSPKALETMNLEGILEFLSRKSIAFLTGHSLVAGEETLG